MTLHRHHRKRRAQGGTDDPENIMLVTPEQHEWIHRNPAEAYARGWLVHSWEDPARVPIQGWNEAVVSERETATPVPEAKAEDLGRVPAPGSECPACHRRVPHPKKETTPGSAVFSYRVPTDEADAHRDVRATAAKFLGVHERPYWQWQVYSLALALVLQDESLRNFGQRSAA